jgi:hypothetical protein
MPTYRVQTGNMDAEITTAVPVIDAVDVLILALKKHKRR